MVCGNSVAVWKGQLCGWDGMLVLKNDLSGHGCFKLLSNAEDIHHYHCNRLLTSSSSSG